MKELFHRRILLLLTILFVALCPGVFGQTDSGIVTVDSPAKPFTQINRRVNTGAIASPKPAKPLKDSVKAPGGTSMQQAISAQGNGLQHFYGFNPFADVNKPLVFREERPFRPADKDVVFYVLIGLLFILGFIRVLFAKYFNDLFRIFFQTTFRQKAIRDQLLQNKIPSLLLNFFFCMSGGLFLYFVASYKGWLQPEGFLQKGAFCVLLVTVVYLTKYIGLRISGWLFGMEEVTETYLFIVFLINKVVGVLLLPAVLILALGNSSLQPVLLVVSLLILIILYLYRYLIVLPLVRIHAGLTGFHFFIYLCAFEVVPVLLVYKFLLLILSR